MQKLQQCPWAAPPGTVNGRKAQYHYFFGIETRQVDWKRNNIRFQAKYKLIEENEVTFRKAKINC